MKKTMITSKTLDHFERETSVDLYTPAEIKAIELAAYVANMTAGNHPEWDENDIYNEFVRVLAIDKIEIKKTDSSTPTLNRLRSNSKAARQNVQRYIMDGFNPDNYEIETPDTFGGIARVIMAVFNAEKPALGSYSRMTEQQRFIDWAQGLPSILDTCYYYNRSAVEDLRQILGEARYTEEKAEHVLTNLIYKELIRGCKA